MNQANPTETQRVRTVPDLLRNEALAAIVVLSVVFLVSALWDAPIERPADPGGIPAQHVKAPWIFVGIQQMLRHLPAVLAGVLLPVAALVVIGLLPWTRLVGPRVRAAVFFGILVTFLLLTAWGYYR